MKPHDWSQMVEELREALDRTAVELSRHEQTLASPLFSSDLAHEHSTSWQRALERFAEQLEAFQNQVDRADQHANTADDLLAQHEKQVQAYYGRLQSMRQTLTESLRML
jgi:uncharacterized protein YukE